MQESGDAAQKLKRSTVDLKNPVNKCGGTGAEDSSKKSLWEYLDWDSWAGC